METLNGRLIITGILELKTGLHIATAGNFSSIGAVDTEIIRDTLTNRPMIPGSSLKGKMRFLLERTKNDKITNENNVVSVSNQVKRLYGSNEKRIVLSRLQFFDIVLSDDSIEKFKGVEFDLPYTEIKYENTINRMTGIAMPRQLERVPAGSEFDFQLVYNIEEINEIEEDIENILKSFDLLEDDYLGGHGTRGYGRVKFKEMESKLKVYDIENNLLDRLNKFNDKFNEKLKNISGE